MTKTTTVSLLTFLLSVLLMLAAVSCRKGTFAQESYQAALTVKSSELSTDQLDVIFDNKQVRDSLPIGKSAQNTWIIGGQEIGAGKRVSFKAYKTGTDTLVADTSVILLKNSRQTFTLISNKDLGLNGFLPETGVPRDSIRIRLKFVDNTLAKQYPSLQFSFYQYTNNDPFYDSTENVNITMPLANGVYSSDFYIPVYEKDNMSFTHLVVRLKDPQSGNYLEWMPAFALFDTPILTSLDAGGVNWDAGNYFFTTATLTDSQYTPGTYDLTFDWKRL